MQVIREALGSSWAENLGGLELAGDCPNSLELDNHLCQPLSSWTGPSHSLSPAPTDLFFYFLFFHKEKKYELRPSSRRRTRCSHWTTTSKLLIPTTAYTVYQENNL